MKLQSKLVSEVFVLDKDEILARNRKDNSCGDERQKDVLLRGYRFSMIVAVVLLGVLCLLKEDLTYLIVINIMSMCRDMYSAIKMRRKCDIVLLIVDLLACAAFIYFHIECGL